MNETAHWEDAIRPATIANLSAGEFVGVVADDPDRELRLKAFHARVMRDEDGKAAHNNISPASITPRWDGGRTPVDPKDIERNFYRVKEDVKWLVLSAHKLSQDK